MSVLLGHIGLSVQSCTGQKKKHNTLMSGLNKGERDGQKEYVLLNRFFLKLQAGRFCKRIDCTRLHGHVNWESLKMSRAHCCKSSKTWPLCKKKKRTGTDTEGSETDRQCRFSVKRLSFSTPAKRRDGWSWIKHTTWRSEALGNSATHSSFM